MLHRHPVQTALVVAIAVACGAMAGWPLAWPGDLLPGARDIPVDGAHGLFLFSAVAARLRGVGPLMQLDELWFPVGRPLLVSVQNIVDAVLAAPLLWWLGPARGLTLASALFMGSNVLAGAWLGGQVRDDPLARLAGALTLGLCPYAWGELQLGRLTQAWLVPLALAVGLAWRAGDGRRRRALYAGAGLALAGYHYWFYGLFGGVAVAAVIFARLPVREAGVRVLLAALSAAVLVAPFATLVALSWQDVPGTQAAAIPFVAPATWLGSLPGTTPTDQYLPHLLVLLGLSSALVAPRRGGVLVAGGLALALLSVGDQLQIGSHTLTMPMHALRQLPVLDRFWWPNRIIAVVATLLVLTLALVAASRRLRPLLWLALPLSVAQWAWSPGMPDAWRVPAVGAWDAALPPGAVLIVPMLDERVGRVALAQQPLHGRPLVNGMGMWEPYLWPAPFREWSESQPLLQALLATERGEPVQAAPEVGMSGVVGVIDVGAQPEERALLERTLGPPTCRGRDCWWRLPR